MNYFSLIFYILFILESICMIIILKKFIQICHRFLIKNYNSYKLSILINQWQNKEDSELFIISEDLTLINRDDYYCINSYDDVLRFVNKLQSMDTTRNIDLILHTDGGDVFHIKLMIDALMNHEGRRRVYIPFKAFSSGTLITLTGNEIYMNKNAHLSPIDTQITINNEDLFQLPIPVGVLSRLTNISEHDHSNLLKINVEMAKKEMYADLKTLSVIFNQMYSVQQMKLITDNFLWTQLPHDYPISVSEAIKFGLEISCNMPQEIVDLEYYIFS